MTDTNANWAPSERIHAGIPAMTASHGAQSPPRKSGRQGLAVRFVTRISDDLSEAVASAARKDGLTAGAYVRRLLLDRVGMLSAEDAKMRPTHPQAGRGCRGDRGGGARA